MKELGLRNGLREENKLRITFLKTRKFKFDPNTVSKKNDFNVNK
jgi:hypothetical protein